MAISPFFFYDSQNHDRQYNSESIEILLRNLFSSGVRAGSGGELKVTSMGGMNIRIATGFAMINGKCTYFDSLTPQTIWPNSTGAVRRDAVIVKRDDNSRRIYLQVKRGEGSAVPTIDEETELLLAIVTVASGVSAITDADITDSRTWMTEAVQEIDFSAFQTQFDTWMSNLNEDLDPESAEGLIADVATLKTNYDSVSAQAENAETAANNALQIVEDIQSGMAGVQMKKIWEISEPGTGVTFLGPQLLIEHEDTEEGESAALNDLTQYQMLLVIAETRTAAASPTRENMARDVVYALLRPGDTTELVCWTPMTAKGATYLDSRKLMWNMGSDVTIEYDSKSPSGTKISGVAAVPSETFGRGLIVYWAAGRQNNTTYKVGNRYEKFGTDGQSWTVPAPANYNTQNNKNMAENNKVNHLLVPVAVYGISGISA